MRSQLALCSDPPILLLLAVLLTLKMFFGVTVHASGDNLKFFDHFEKSFRKICTTADHFHIIENEQNRCPVAARGTERIADGHPTIGGGMHKEEEKQRKRKRRSRGGGRGGEAIGNQNGKAERVIRQTDRSRRGKRGGGGDEPMKRTDKMQRRRVNGTNIYLFYSFSISPKSMLKIVY